MTRRGKSLRAAFVGGLAVALLLAGFLRGVGGQERTMPDRFDFGVVEQGAIVEFEARLLSPRATILERAFDSLAAHLPAALARAAGPLDPKRLRQPLPATALNALRLDTPEFVRVASVRAPQITNWHLRASFIAAEFALDTSKTGVFDGEILGEFLGRRARAPVRVTVRPPSGLGRTLVISPFRGSATGYGDSFAPAIGLLSALPGRVDCLLELPGDLSPYRSFLIADAPLARLTDPESVRLSQALRSGGRLVMACNGFHRGAVAAANRLLRGHGLKVLDAQSRGEAWSTKIEPDPLTHGVSTLRFQRGSPIQVTGPRARPLVWSGTNCYAAAARAENGGEIVVLAQSLWWHWLLRFETNSDAKLFLQNALNGPRTQR